MEDIANTSVMHMHVSSSHLSLYIYIAEEIWTGMLFYEVLHESWNGHDVWRSI